MLNTIFSKATKKRRQFLISWLFVDYSDSNMSWSDMFLVILNVLLQHVLCVTSTCCQVSTFHWFLGSKPTSHLGMSFWKWISIWWAYQLSSFIGNSQFHSHFISLFKHVNLTADSNTSESKLLHNSLSPLYINVLCTHIHCIENSPAFKSFFFKFENEDTQMSNLYM